MKKRYVLLCAGMSFAAVSAALGIEQSAFAYKVVGCVLAVIIANASLRFVVVKIAQHFSLAHPLLESQWPRMPWRAVCAVLVVFFDPSAAPANSSLSTTITEETEHGT